MLAIRLFLWMLVLFGHVALWVALFNRLHAWAIPRWFIAITEKILIAVALLGVGFWCWWGVLHFDGPSARLIPLLEGRAILGSMAATQTVAAYALLSGGMGVLVAAIWLIRKLFGGTPGRLLRNDNKCLAVDRELDQPLAGSPTARLFRWVPRQQMFALHIQQKQLVLDGLPAALDGVTVAHFSDLHLTGKICRPYFEYLADRVMELDADLIAITGDLIDSPSCIPWLPHTVGRLAARHGVYYILGNHDERKGCADEIRATLQQCGLVDLGGRQQMLSLRNDQILLAGNELPWFGPAPAMETAPQDEEIFRLLLAHTPDQLPWAKRHRFDLMLAGHTHGGQIRLPVIGPVVSPSHYGVKYASGLFYEPPTLMHVTRGISGKTPIRWNCAPELAKLILRSGQLLAEPSAVSEGTAVCNSA